MSSVNCIGTVYGCVRCAPYGAEVQNTAEYAPSSSYIPMVSYHPLACIATRNDLRKIFFTARRRFVWSPSLRFPDFQQPPRGFRVLDPDLWANHHGPSGHAPFLPSRNTTDFHSATFCNFATGTPYISQAFGIGRILSAPEWRFQPVCLLL